MGSLNEIVTMYLDYAERQARRGNIMYMRDWVARLDAFLQFNEEEVLHHKGKVTAAIAKAFAESEFEKYPVLHDIFQIHSRQKPLPRVNLKNIV